MYMRPREKLRRKGASALADTELLQLIVGTGGASVSGAKLARLVSAALNRGKITYDALLCIKGVGDTKACLILALQEYARRHHG